MSRHPRLTSLEESRTPCQVRCGNPSGAGVVQGVNGHDVLALGHIR